VPACACHHPSAEFEEMRRNAFVTPLATGQLHSTAVGSAALKEVVNKRPTFLVIAHQRQSAWHVDQIVRMLTQLPLKSAGTNAVNYKLVCKQAAAAIIALATGDEPERLLTVDFPPERSETRAGTLVSRYENNINFAEKLLTELGVPFGEWESRGGTVEIMNNNNPQGGGDYLTDDECVVALRGKDCPNLGGCRGIMVMINAGVDASTLKQVKTIDDKSGGMDVIVLVNCGLDRLDFFSKLGTGKYFDLFATAFYLKLILGSSQAALIRCYPGKWTAFVSQDCVIEFDHRPTVYKIEQLVRNASSSR
jgi:hypothetical protein